MAKLQKIIVGIGFWAGAIILPAMIIIRVYEIVARNVFGKTSSLPQLLEWELFVLLVLAPLGFAYLRNSHVRVDIIRERLPEKWRARVELAGFVLFIVPVTAVIIYYGVYYAAESHLMGERLALFLGAPGRWLLKAAMPFGFFLLLLAGVIVAVRNWRFLRGRHDRAEPR